MNEIPNVKEYNDDLDKHFYEKSKKKVLDMLKFIKHNYNDITNFSITKNLHPKIIKELKEKGYIIKDSIKDINSFEIFFKNIKNI